MTQKNNFDNFLKFAKEKIGVEFESPRKIFGRRIFPQNFKIVEIDDNRQRIKIQFESGTPLPLEYWRFEEAITFIDKKDFVPIGARVSENYLKNSLEGTLKEKAKKDSKKITDTKTAPHIADLLILAGLAELGYTKSSGNRKIQGIRLKADLK